MRSQDRKPAGAKRGFWSSGLVHRRREASEAIRPRESKLMTLAEVCVKRPVFAVMLIGFLVVLGVFSFRDLGVDLFPTADPATVTIQVRLPGASPVEMNSQ